jgi:hypothetical protein
MSAKMAQFSGGRTHFAWHGHHNGDLDAAAAMSAQELSEALANGNPSIAALVSDNSLEVVVNQLYEGETEIVGTRLQELLGG